MDYRKNRIKSVFGNIDFITLALTVTAALMGLVAIRSATYSYGSRMFIVQSAAIGIGIVLFITLSKLDFDMFSSAAVVIYIVNIVLLILVLIIGMGKSETGTQGWINLGIVSFQPAEIVKIGFIITFSKHLTKVKEDIDRIPTLLMLALHAVILIGLVLLQPDVGTAMVFAFIFIVMLFISGFNYKYLIVFAVAAAVILALVWIFRDSVLAPHQIDRINVFFDPYKDPAGAGYNVIQSEISIGSGKIIGQGYLNGTLNQFEYLPAKHTDFIFATIGEEWGFFGSFAVVIILTVMIVRCIVVARKARNEFGSLLCVGIAAMLGFHMIENIGMCLQLMPVTGIPLPFFSYGGTSVVTNMIAMGIVSSVNVRSKSAMKVSI